MRLRECFHRLRVDGRPKRVKKFAFTIVCVYNRLRVDGALVAIHSSLSNLPLLQKVKMVAQHLAKDTLSV